MCFDGVVLCCEVWYGMVWYGMVWYGMVWYGTVCCNVVWCGMISIPHNTILHQRCRIMWYSMVC